MKANWLTSFLGNLDNNLEIIPSNCAENLLKIDLDVKIGQNLHV